MRLKNRYWLMDWYRNKALMQQDAVDTRPTILVVDDTLENIDVLCNLLQAHYRLRVATSGIKALEILRSPDLPDIVLLDAIMPGLSGFEVCTRIKSDPRLRHIPVLFVTSLNQTADETKALSIGAADYITKPFSPAVVLARVKAHLALAEYSNQLEKTVRERTLALSDKEERLRLAVNAGSLAIFDYDLRVRKLTVYPDNLEALDISALGFDGTVKWWMKQIHPDDVSTIGNLFQQVRRKLLGNFSFEFRHRTISDDWNWVLMRGGVAEQARDGKPLRIIGAMTNITQRKKSESQLKQAAQVFMQAAESISIVDDAGRFIEVNEAFVKMTGYERDEVIGKAVLDILYADMKSSEFFVHRERLIEENGHWSGEVWAQRKNGETFPAMVTINIAHHADGHSKNRIVFTEDLTERKTHQNQLERIAHYDTLTGLPNRSLLKDRLQQALAQARRQANCLAVAMIDLDDFQDINSRYSHYVGDQLIINLSQRLTSLLREGDTLARIGGDEFVAVLVGMKDEEDCRASIELLHHALIEAFEADSGEIQVTASIGVTLFPLDGADADLLLRHADQAMYVAKQKGKNRIRYFDLDEDRAARLQESTIERIDQALKAGEFALYYQPKVNMRTGEVIGAEALIRWISPQRGILSPGMFLPVIEAHPLIIDIGEWVIHEALSQMAQWKAAGLKLPVSVNIGTPQLQQRNFPARLRSLLELRPEVPPSWLELEILETNALTDIAWASEVIRECQSLGVTFAIDDFGTGYSSLSYLKRLPCEILKVDQSFVRDMLSDPDALSIVRMVISLASAFRRDVVAEGVETVAHGKALIEMNCPLGQGYGIAHPMPGSEMIDWISKWKSDAFQS